MDIFSREAEEAEYDSDEESVISIENEPVIENWEHTGREFSDFSIHTYTLSLQEEEKDDEFVIESIVEGVEIYERNFTAIRLRADIILEDGTRQTEKTIRLENTSEMKENLREILQEMFENNTAPIWHRLEFDETSDKVTGNIVIYDKKFFEILVQKKAKSKTHITLVTGEIEIHPGFYTKVLTGHGIDYMKNDCLIQCLNEIFNERERPMEIRKQIFRKGDRGSYLKKDMHTIRHITEVCRIYDCKLYLYDIGRDESTLFNDEGGSREAKLVKLGRTIGILDRIVDEDHKDDVPIDYVFFDLETVGREQRPYAFSFMSRNREITLCNQDSEYIEREFISNLIRFLDERPPDYSVVAYAWNGSRFDNWIALKILKKNYRTGLRVKDIVVNSANELLSFTLMVSGAKMIFRDPKKLFSISIPEACKIFNLEDNKEEFNHDIVEKTYYEESKNFEDFITYNRDKIISYVRKDVELLFKITMKIRELYKEEDINILSVMTRSVASNILWQKTIEHRKILKDVTISPYKEYCGVKYNDIMDHAIGGRTQCIKKGTFQNVCGIDVNSMYPHVCANNEYPCGSIVETKEYKPGKLGLYLVNIKKQSYPNPIPYRRYKHQAYDWNYDKPFLKWITSVDLEQLDEYDVIKGLYWTEKTDGFYKEFMYNNYSARMEIDKDDVRNLHIKLKMNGVTGTSFQNSFRELIQIIPKEEVDEISKKYEGLIKIIGCEEINSKEYILTMKPIKLREEDPRIKAQKEFCRGAISQKPWVLTMFTYSYARKLLRDKWIELENKGCEILYCDTDSIIFINNRNIKRKDYDYNKEMGEWTTEFWNDEGTFHSPKIYAIKKKKKIRVKGYGYYSCLIDDYEKAQEMNYKERLQLFIDKQTSENPEVLNYERVKQLVEGKPLISITFYMEKTKQKGIEKKYVIRRIKA